MAYVKYMGYKGYIAPYNIGVFLVQIRAGSATVWQRDGLGFALNPKPYLEL